MLRLLFLLGCLLPLLGCSSPTTNRDPLGEPFPTVTGRSLAGDEVALPPGENAVLLIGYLQKAQFDADRGLYGLLQAKLPVRVLEVPTIPGLFPSLFKGSIDEGMRGGIPSEDWASVVTLYGDRAKPIAALTGTENGNNIRVLLLDASGHVRWFHDRGFSAGKLIELEQAARALGTTEAR
jgi:hypothetical protein